MPSGRQYPPPAARRPFIYELIQIRVGFRWLIILPIFEHLGRHCVATFDCSHSKLHPTPRFPTRVHLLFDWWALSFPLTWQAWYPYGSRLAKHWRALFIFAYLSNSRLSYTVRSSRQVSLFTESNAPTHVGMYCTLFLETVYIIVKKKKINTFPSKVSIWVQLFIVYDFIVSLDFFRRHTSHVCRSNFTHW